MTDALPSSELLTFFKALAHESRLKLVGLLTERERSVQELATLVSLKEPTVSHHLAMLREAGLVRLRQDGNTHWYALETKTLATRAKTMLMTEKLAELAVAGGTSDKSVLNYLTPEGRLKVFPASIKKRRPILRWLARHFDEGRTYSEAEVNATIERRHHDFETFRREMVGYKMLARKSGQYWRLPDTEWVG
ncbi:MAG: metalloregulator ArsR/SmtB family transcription factor [Micropepsaceae bacterium]